MVSEGARQLAEKIGEKRGAQVRLQEAFLAHGKSLSEGLVSRWLTGERRPNLDNAVMLEKLFGIEPASWAKKPRRAA